MKNENNDYLFSVTEENGVAVDYLVNGCPLLVGCIWEITDKDSDNLLMNVLNILNKSKRVCHSIQNYIQKSRNECKLKYLNGSSFVCYGIPVYLKYYD